MPLLPFNIVHLLYYFNDCYTIIFVIHWNSCDNYTLIDIK